MAVAALPEQGKTENRKMIEQQQQTRPSISEITRAAEKAIRADDVAHLIEAIALNAVRAAMAVKGRAVDNFGPEDMRVKRLVERALEAVPAGAAANMDAAMRSTFPPAQSASPRLVAGIEAMNADPAEQTTGE